MRTPPFFLFCFLLFLLAACEGDEKNSSAKKDSAKSDSAESEALCDADESAGPRSTANDSTYELRIGGKRYELMLTHDEFPSVNDVSPGTITVRIVDEKHDTLLRKTLDFNMTGLLRNPAPGHYWIALLNSGGGSGYSATLFNIRVAPEAKLQPLFNFHELTSWKTDRTASQVLLFDGIWDMGDPESEDFEAHFSPHKQVVYLYEIKEDTVLWKEIGTTKNKYELSENEMNLDTLRLKEPELAEKIRLSDFD